MECNFCHNTFANKQNLNAHQKKAKYCLKLQGKNIHTKFICEICQKTFTSKYNLNRHKKICDNNSLIKKLRDKNINNENEIKILKNIIKELRLDKKELQERYDKLSLTAVKRPVNNTKNIQINNFIQNMEPLRI